MIAPKFKRSAGVLMPVSSLPSAYGIGCFSRDAETFADMAKDMGFSWWQVLPITILGAGNSPYSGYSTHAGNFLYINPMLMKEEGLLTAEEAEAAKYHGAPYKVDYAFARENIKRVLHIAFERLTPEIRQKIAEFEEEESDWLPDYALFMALADRFGGDWTEWEHGLAFREEKALAEARREFAREIEYKRDHDGRKPPVGFRSVENVVEEIDQLAAQGYKAIGFMDDNFIVTAKRLKGIGEALLRHGIVWGCQARVDAINEEVAAMLKEYGCQYVDLGVESFNDDILKYIKKGITEEQIHRAIALLKEHGVPVKLNILIGTSPLETKETIKDTLRKAKALKVDQVMFNIVSPFPATEFYDLAKENGWIEGGEYVPTDVQRNSILSYPNLSSRDMERLLFRNNLRFFLSPAFIWRNIRQFSSFKEFCGAAKALWIKLFG